MGWSDRREGGRKEKVGLHIWGGGAAATRTFRAPGRAPPCSLPAAAQVWPLRAILKIKAARAGIAHQEKKFKKNQSRPCVFFSVCLT